MSELKTVLFDQWLDEPLTTAQQAAELKKSVAWCERARWDGSGPAYFKVGRTPYYTRRMNREWLEAQKRTWTRGAA